MHIKDKLLPGIKEYLEANDNNLPVTSENLDELIYKIIAGTGMSYNQSETVVRLYFQELRNELLKKQSVYLALLGIFTLKKYRVYFAPIEKFERKINAEPDADS